MWDYDKLFAEGNVVGLKNKQQNRIFSSPVYGREFWGKEGCVDWRDYYNESLSISEDENYEYTFEIVYVVRLDEHGNVVEKLFDREVNMPKPMPELETGMFVKIYSSYRNESILAFIYNNRVIYQDGDWDEIYDLTEDIIMEVYSNKALCFNNCQEPYLIWRNTKY